MNRIIRNLDFVVAFLFVLGLTVACPKKEEPGPEPEPTPEATIVVVGEAVCYVANLPVGTPPVCKDAGGSQVNCPADMSAIPACN
jgi:hypothetical protein